MNNYNLRIIEKINLLKKYDVHCIIFGAKKHKYLLNPTMTESEIKLFEDKFGISLPEDYRNFIKNIGNGGAGPGYGLYKLDVNNINDIHGYMKRPFLLTKDFDVDEEGEKYNCSAYTCQECEHKDLCLISDDYNGECSDICRYQQGTLTICFEGCTYYRRIILNGPKKGEIWAESEGEGLKQSEASFSEWYEGWLDKSLNTIMPYVNAVKENKSFEEILKIDGRGKGMFYFPYIKAYFVDGLLGLNISFRDDFNRKRDEEEYIKQVKNAYEKRRVF